VSTSGPAPAVPLTRADLRHYAQRPLKESHSWLGQDVIELSRGDERYILKDTLRRPRLVRDTWCRFIARREVRAYRALQGIPGIPRIVSVLDDYAFVIEFVEANPLPRRRGRDDVGLEFFEKLDALFDAMHARGVAHCDIRRRNVLISAARQPWLIDFEAAFFDGPAGWRRRVFRYMSEVDRLTALKIRNKYFPEETSARERERLERPPILLRIGRFMRQRVYGPISPKALKARFAGRNRGGKKSP
jgi:predicted Ser/Thr protein kinase